MNHHHPNSADPARTSNGASPLLDTPFSGRQSSMVETMAATATFREEDPTSNISSSKASTTIPSSFSSSSSRTSNNTDNSDSSFVVWTNEIKALLHIALPTLMIQLGFVVPPFLTASYVGRYFGPVYLDGFQLAYLTINLFALSLLAGLFSAADTLSPQAFGAGNYAAVGVIAVRGLVASLVLVIPLSLILCWYMTDLLVWFGQDAVAAQHAAAWYRTFCIAMPTFGIYMAIWKFLSAQNCMMPLVVASMISIGVVLPTAMEWGVSMFGFCGSAAAYALYQISQVVCLAVILWLYQPHYAPCWPGWNVVWNEVFDAKAYAQFLYLGMGGIVASSEWIYWETISLGIGTLGVVSLSVHTVPSQFLTIAFMVSFGIGVSLSVRLGHVLPQNARRAKYLVWGTTVVSCLVFALVSVALYHFRTRVYHIFTKDPVVMAGCEIIWDKVCWYFFLVSWFALNTGIANGLGMQWLLGKVTILFLWFLGVPALWYYGLNVYESLNVVWEWIFPPYVLINLSLLASFAAADWDEISMDIRKREGLTSDAAEVDHVGPYGITYGSVDESAQPLVVA